MKVSIIDTGSANLNSVRQALKRLGCDPVVSSDPQELAANCAISSWAQRSRFWGSAWACRF